MSALETKLQETIESLYRLEPTANVADFRIGQEVLEAVLGAGATGEHRETLVVHDGDEGVDVALYIADDVLARAQAFLASHDVGNGERPGEDHLDEFCVATEGVSHFVYLTYCGERQARPVSAIELELQAEVDKYLVLRLCLAVPGRVLVERLFDHFRLHERLSPGERERYRVANQVGRRYARWFDRQVALGNVARALDDARALYRKPFASKLEHIDRAA